ncbi:MULTISPECIES: hypothetical protein [unclassified Pseudoxanthomonas]|uniref:hypothetical protein n=1 Tax=unclassified Pseudoxanthomonas TaxID=2645906 RepID=UPI003077F631
MRQFFAIGLLASVLMSCASARLGDEKVPTAEQLVGSYAMGWGGICYEVHLRADQSYSGMDCAGGHFGPTDGPDRHFSGQWTLQGKVLSFSSVSPTGKPDLSPAEVFFYKGSPAFVELEFVDKEKVAPMFLFTRQNTE